jgi:hypothetical protein
VSPFACFDRETAGHGLTPWRRAAVLSRGAGAEAEHLALATSGEIRAGGGRFSMGSAAGLLLAGRLLTKHRGVAALGELNVVRTLVAVDFLGAALTLEFSNAAGILDTGLETIGHGRLPNRGDIHLDLGVRREREELLNSRAMKSHPALDTGTGTRVYAFPVDANKQVAHAPVGEAFGRMPCRHDIGRRLVQKLRHRDGFGHFALHRI